MKNGGVFSRWFKEFASLVFVQTVQAFVLALVLSVVLSAANSDEMSTDSGVSAVGLIAIIALASLHKIEAITKKIFGVDSSIVDTSMKGGMKSTLVGLAAVKSFGRVLNNGALMAKGAGQSAISSHMMKKKAQNELMKKKNRYLGAGADGTGTGGTGADGTGTGGTGAGGTGAGGTGAGGTGAGGAAAINDKTRDKLEAAYDRYEEQLDAAKKKRAEGFKNIAKGGIGTIGATLGGATGAVAGLATGETDDILKGIGFGVGAGDYLGEKSVDLVSGAVGQIYDIKKAAKQSSKYTRKELKSAIKEIQDKVDAGNL